MLQPQPPPARASAALLWRRSPIGSEQECMLPPRPPPAQCYTVLLFWASSLSSPARAAVASFATRKPFYSASCRYAHPGREPARPDCSRAGGQPAVSIGVCGMFSSSRSSSSIRGHLSTADSASRFLCGGWLLVYKERPSIHQLPDRFINGNLSARGSISHWLQRRVVYCSRVSALL